MSVSRNFISDVGILIISLFIFSACGGGGSSPANSENDTIPPVIKILGENPTTIKLSSNYSDAGATALDNKDGKVSVTNSGSVNTSKAATYIITYNANDKAGNKATATRKVIVKTGDIEPPIITLKGSSSIEIFQGDTFDDLGATAYDKVDGTVKVTRTGSVNTTKIGRYTLIYTATDKAGNKASKTRQVRVKIKVILDKIPPVITIIGANPLEINQGESFSDPGATAKDNIDGIVSVTPSSTVKMDVVGKYTITYIAGDKAGNTVQAKRTVIVKAASVISKVSTVAEFRQALEDAAANGQHDRIILSKGTYKTTSDGLGTFDFNDSEAFNLTIESASGLTRDDVILDGNNTNQVLNFKNERTYTLTLKNINIINGNTKLHGGGFYAKTSISIDSDIQIINCNIEGNSSDQSGGGFFVNSEIKIINSNISNNHSKNGNHGFGGGGFYTSSTAVIENSTIISNISFENGGGFKSYKSIIRKTTIEGNISYEEGGGFESELSIIKNSNIKNNQSKTGVGGGFYTGDAEIINSNISNNNAIAYSGFYSSRALVINSLFDKNKTKENRSTIYANNESVFINNNFTDNQGGIYAYGVFINNIFKDNYIDIKSNYSSFIYNNYINYKKIINVNNNAIIKKKNLQSSVITELNINTNNKTLLSNSPAINKGLNPSSSTFKDLIDNYDIYKQLNELLKIDMIGNKRIHNGTIDIGAVEYGSSK